MHFCECVEFSMSLKKNERKKKKQEIEQQFSGYLRIHKALGIVYRWEEECVCTMKCWPSPLFSMRNLSPRTERLAESHRSNLWTKDQHPVSKFFKIKNEKQLDFINCTSLHQKFTPPSVTSILSVTVFFCSKIPTGFF